MPGVTLSPHVCDAITDLWAEWQRLNCPLPLPIERILIARGWQISNDRTVIDHAAHAASIDGIHLVSVNPSLLLAERQAAIGWAYAAYLDGTRGYWLIRHYRPDNQFLLARSLQRLMITARLLIPDAVLAECDSFAYLSHVAKVMPWLIAGRLLGEDVSEATRRQYLSVDPLDWQVVRAIEKRAANE